MALTMNQKSVPAPARITTRISAAPRSGAVTSAERGEDQRDREQRLHAEHGPVAERHMPQATDRGDRPELRQRDGATLVDVASEIVPAGDHGDEVGRGEHDRGDRADGHGGRPLARRERLQGGAGGLVLRPAAGVAARGRLVIGRLGRLGSDPLSRSH